MAKKPPPPEESPGGAPKWMVTFSDCMTLLLTFFVLLLTFSSFDDKAFQKMTTSLSTAMPSIAQSRKANDAVLQNHPILYQPDRDRGSEKADPDADTEGVSGESENLLDFERRRVFIVDAENIFLGLGAELSEEGRDMLTDFAVIARDMRHHIVISEHENPAPGGIDPLGVRRARSIVRYLTSQEKMQPKRFAVTGSPTVPIENIPQNAQDVQASRLLEITLLDRSVSQ